MFKSCSFDTLIVTACKNIEGGGVGEQKNVKI
jgi:hypothetical protein